MGRPLSNDLLQCPDCNSIDLHPVASAMRCAACNRDFPVISGQVRFTTTPESVVSDRLDKLKYRLKAHAKLYNLLIEIISPVYFSRCLPKYIDRIPSDAVALNLGSGSSDLSDRLTNVDMFPYATVNITADIANLPIRTGSIDNIVNIAVLEHVPDPAAVVRQIYRVLRPGGEVYCYFPFIQGFHASPYDFTRLTEEGMRHLFRDFQIVNLRPEGGPTSGALWVMQEWLAMLLSFGIRPLYTALHLALMVLTCPIKLLDAVLIHHPMAKNISTAFVVIARKPVDQA